MKKIKMYTFNELMTKYTEEELKDIERRMWEAESIMSAQKKLCKPHWFKDITDYGKRTIVEKTILALTIVSAVSIASKNLKITVSVKGDMD